MRRCRFSPRTLVIVFLVSLTLTNLYFSYNKKGFYKFAALRLYNEPDHPHKYFLTAVIMVRMYAVDQSRRATEELKQWIEYMQYAGVEHFYVYDDYIVSTDNLKPWCEEFFTSEEITYVDWSTDEPYSIDHHTRAYNDALQTFKSNHLTKWQIQFDMDEYPFVANDTEPGFLSRFIQKQSQLNPEISEFSIDNFLFLGKRKNYGLVIEQMIRRTPEAVNRLNNPIFKVDCVEECGAHHNVLMCGSDKDVPSELMRMNHYYGIRLQNWGEDTPEILEKTIVDESALSLAEKIKFHLRKKGYK